MKSITLSNTKKLIVISMLAILFIPSFTLALDDDCEYTYFDKDVMDEKIGYYEQKIQEYESLIEECRQDYSLSTCYDIWGTFLSYYQTCIDDAELISPVDCQRFAEYNFETKLCECNEAYLADGEECIYRGDYCIKYYGFKYAYNLQTKSCEINTIISDTALNEYCTDLLGENALFKKTAQECGCYEPYILVDNACFKQDQIIVPGPQSEDIQTTQTTLEGELVKTEDSAAVYLIQDGIRRVFPNVHIYKTWFGDDFSSVETITRAELIINAIGSNITFKPGSLIKVDSNPKIYVVTDDAVIRWVSTEEKFNELGYSFDDIKDVPVVFFSDYTEGVTIE